MLISAKACFRTLIFATAATLTTLPAHAQKPSGGQMQKAAPQAAPAPAAVKSYKAVVVKLSPPMNDPAFETFRKQMGEAAQKKDRAALAKLVVGQGFFWDAEDGDKADKKKTGIDNLSSAIDLAGKDANGWDLLVGYSGDPTATPSPQHQGAVCTPADPVFDDKELEELAKSTQTDAAEWGYPLSDGVEVRASAQPNAAVVEKLGLHFVRVIQEDADSKPNESGMVRVATPSGKSGYVSGDAVAPLGNDQICYIKDASGWKITGFIGGGSDQ